MNLKRAIKGTALEAPARRLRKTFFAPQVTPQKREPTPAELRILACATQAKSYQQNPSIFFWTTHKCASTFAARILAEIGRSGGRRHFDYAGAIWRLGDALHGEEPYSLMSNNYSNLFFSNDEVYGPMRKPISTQDPNKYRMIFFLRDPRDVAVSAYYSFGYSHGIPKNSKRREVFLENRAKIQSEGIDQYAIRAAADWLAPTYKEYALLRRRASHHLYIRYEDYIDDPGDTIKKIFDFCDISTDVARLKELTEAASPIVAKEDKSAELRHKRSGRSGQFRSELTTETIDRIDEIFSETLEAWGFPK